MYEKICNHAKMLSEIYIDRFWFDFSRCASHSFPYRLWNRNEVGHLIMATFNPHDLIVEREEDDY